MTPSGIEPGSFRLVAQCPNQLSHPALPLSKDQKLNNTMAGKMEKKLQRSDRQLGSSWSAVGLTETSNRSVVSCQDCNVQQPRVLQALAGSRNTECELQESIFRFMPALFWSTSRSVTDTCSPALLFTCSPAHTQQARPSDLSTGATQSAQQVPHWLFNILGRKLT